MERLDVTMLETLKADLSGVSANYMEIGLDGILEDGLLKDIPVVNSIISLYKTGVNIRERFLIKKLLVFLTSLSDTTIEARLEFIRKHEKQSAKIGEKLIVLLDRLDHVNKPEYVAKLFKHYLCICQVKNGPKIISKTVHYFLLFNHEIISSYR